MSKPFVCLNDLPSEDDIAGEEVEECALSYNELGLALVNRGSLVSLFTVKV